MSSALEQARGEEDLTCGHYEGDGEEDGDAGESETLGGWDWRG